MPCYITVRPLREKEFSSRFEINGIFESEEQAWRSIGPEAPPNSAVYPWTMHQPARLNAPVEIHDGQIVPIAHSRLFAFLDNALRRDEISHLHQKNEALVRHVAHLEDQLDKRLAPFVHDRDSLPASRQIRDLWVCSTPKAAEERIVRDFVDAERPTLDGRVIVVPDAEIIPRLNREVQQARINAGTIDASEGMAHNRVLLHDCDRVCFLRADDELKVTAGDLAEVISIFPQFRTIAVAVDRGENPSDFVLVPLREYGDLDLGYATLCENAKQMPSLYQVFVLANSSAPTREFIEALPCHHVEVYADPLSAARLFPEQSLENRRCPAIDLTVDPLAAYHSRD